MFLEIVKFEMIYRFRRPVTYIYFGLFLAISFMMVAIPEISYSDAADQLLKNSPVLITQLMLAILIFGSIVCAAIMGVPVYRDYEHNFYEIIHSLPIKKSTYLWGRFAGSYLVSILIFSSIVLGMALGFAMPWQESDTIGPFQLSVYLRAYFFFIIPNVFVIGSLFFIVGSYFRSQVAIYAQGVLFVVLYFIVGILFQDTTQNPVYSIFEPFGSEAISQVSRYWTTYEKNMSDIDLSGLILYNRLLWVGLAGLLAILFNWRFSVTQKKTRRLFKRSHAEKPVAEEEILVSAGMAMEKPGWKDRLYQWWHLSKFYFRTIVRSIPFLITLACAIGFMAMARFGTSIMYGTPSLPVTYMLLDNLTAGFMIFAIILLVVYSGELIWKDIGNRFALILDSSPLQDQQIMLSKFTAMILAELLILGVIVLTGMGVQIINGFYEFQIPVYLKFLLLNFFPTLFLMTLLTFLIHTLVSNKFLGHGLIILFYIFQGFYGKLGIWHMMFRYGSFPSENYSGMNGFHKFVFPALSMEFYWLMLGIVLLSLSILFIKRGTENTFRTRLHLFRLNWQNSRIKLIITGALALFILSGCAIYYSTNVVNVHRTKKENRLFQASYEKNYEKFKDSPQPRIVDVNVAVDIYPEKYGMEARGKYLLVNKNERPVDSIHVRMIPEIEIENIQFSRSSTLCQEAPEYGYFIYALDESLLPGDTLTCDFEIAFWEKGFRNWGRRTEIVPNGTFFRNDFLPWFGYDERFVITDKKERKKAGLPEREFESAALTDTSAYGNTYISQNADRIHYEAVVSTSADQTALTCGKLVDEWEKDGRRYFHYRMDEPIWNFFPFLSAKYAVMNDTSGKTAIEIYYHPKHDYNLDKMMAAARKTLAYCDSQFYPFQHSVLRIVEFPRYGSFAQSFPGIIPFSEGVGFIVDVDDKKGLDLPFYVTSHEVAHQWWGHQVCAADVKGKLLMVESLANYTALMVMEKEYGNKDISKFLEYEQTRYLRGRSLERKKEVPLNLVDNQSYVAYQKGSIALYSLRDYIGEDKLNEQLSRFIQYYSYREAPYPTSVDFLRYIEQAVPDSLDYLTDDLFRSITLFSNRIDSAIYRKTEAGKYEVIFSTINEKYYADSIGRQTESVPKDWMDIGIYTRGSEDEDSLIYLKKMKIDTTLMHFRITVDSKPSKVGIDPMNKLIDRNLMDNSKAVKESV